MFQGLLDYFSPKEGSPVSFDDPSIAGYRIPISEYGNVPGGAPMPQLADDPQFIGQSIPFEDAQPFAPSGGRGFVQPNMYDMTQYMAARDMNYLPQSTDPMMPGSGPLGGRGYMSENPYARNTYMEMQSEPPQKRMTMTTAPRSKFDKQGFNSGLQMMNMGLGLLD